MFRAHNISTLTLSFLALIPTIRAWLFSTTNINLSSPPPLNFGYAVENGTALADYPTSAFPCADVSVPPSVPRTPFPISGGRLSYNLSNITTSSLKDYNYNINVYLGQISLGDGRYSTATQAPGSGRNSGYAYAATEVWKNFTTGQDCSVPFDAVELVSGALGQEVTAEGLVGRNATFALRIVLFGPNKMYPDIGLADYTQEEMYQCGYVTFTSDDLSKIPDTGYCNGGGEEATPGTLTHTSSTIGISITPTTLLTTQSLAPYTTTRSAVPTDSPTSSRNSTAVASSDSQSHAISVGAGVGVSMGASLMILIIVFALMRRRKARKASETIGADIMVTRPLGEEKVASEKGEKEKGKERGVDNSGNSVHSEPLPMYTPAVEVSESDPKQNMDRKVSEV